MSAQPHRRSVTAKWNYGYAAKGKITSRDQLTPRHREILMLVAQGWMDKQIAKMLKISPSTLHSHMLLLAEVLNIPKGYSTRVLMAKWYWEQRA